MRQLATILCCATALMPAAVFAQGAGGRASDNGPMLVRDVTLIDGTGAAERPHMSFLVRDGRIVWLGPASDQPSPAVDSVIDGRGLFAIPGLIDAHVHTGQGPWEHRASDLRHTLEGGVTSVFELAGDTRATGDLQRAVITGQIPGPHIYYVALFGGPSFFSDPRTADASRGYRSGTAPWMQAVTDATDFAHAVAMAKGTGATGLKLYAALDSLEVARATVQAHRQGLRVIAHATTFPGKPSDLVASGADMLAHTPYLVWQGSARSERWQDRAKGDFLHVPADGPVMQSLLQSMAARGVALNPTLWIFSNELPHDSVARVRSPWMYAVTRRALALGVRIVSGTDDMFDASVDSLPVLHRELQVLVDSAGFTPLQALTTATANGAWAIGIADSVGTLTVGKNADFVLLGGDPTTDIRNTRSIRVVVQGGRVVHAK